MRKLMDSLMWFLILFGVAAGVFVSIGAYILYRMANIEAC
jgi:hypothetical protein